MSVATKGKDNNKQCPGCGNNLLFNRELRRFECHKCQIVISSLKDDLKPPAKKKDQQKFTASTIREAGAIIDVVRTVDEETGEVSIEKVVHFCPKQENVPEVEFDEAVGIEVRERLKPLIQKEKKHGRDNIRRQKKKKEKNAESSNKD